MGVMSAEGGFQKQCVELLEAMGYEARDASAREGGASGVLFESVLREFLEKRTFWHDGRQYAFSPENITRAIAELDVSLQGGLMGANEAITEKLLHGKSYEENLHGTYRSFTLSYIDFEQPQNNIYHVVRELSVQDGALRRPDIVLYVNGIPLVVIELKSAIRSMDAAVAQLITAQREIPKLFCYAQLCIAGNIHGGKYGTIGTGEQFYGEWREEDERRESVLRSLVHGREVCAFDKLLFGLLSKDRLLYIIKNFVFFEKGKGKTYKKVCRHQQFSAIEAILKRVETRVEGTRCGGVVWHTQGSGKSLTMALLAKLILDRYLEHGRVVIITDRRELDSQITDTFRRVGMDVKHADSGARLKELLGSGIRLITTLVHKFDNQFSQALDSPDVFVFVDEAHRTQNGELNEKMREVLGRACYIAFTGTPLLKDEKKKFFEDSFDRFGVLIHRYSIDDAVRDGAVLPLLYENRLASQEVDAERLREGFEDMARGMSAQQREELERGWATKEKVHSTQGRLEAIAQDIKRHFRGTLSKGFRAMLAARTRYDALRYHEIFARDESEDRLRSACVITGDNQDALRGEPWRSISEMWNRQWESVGSPEGYIAQAKERFASDDEEGEAIDILIVVDKLLTGFDEPRASVLYLDKRLERHNLLQAIARVNRVYAGKSCGLIIDYEGLLENLKTTLARYKEAGEEMGLAGYECLAGYDEKDLQGVLLPIEEEIDRLKEYEENLQAVFVGVKHKEDIEGYMQVLEDEGERKRFKDGLRAFASALNLALSAKKYLQGIDLAHYKERLEFYEELRAAMRARYEREDNLDAYNESMRHLLDRCIQTTGVRKIVEAVDILGLPKQQEDAEEICKNLEACVDGYRELDPVFYGDISERIQKILQDYEAKRISEAQKLEKLQELRELEQARVSVCARQMYDYLRQNLRGMDERRVAEEAKYLEGLYEVCKKKPNWWESEEQKNQLSKRIVARLFEHIDGLHKRLTDGIWEIWRGLR